MIRTLVILLPVILISSKVNAQQCTEFNKPDKARIYYVNGMLSSETDNNRARAKLEQVVNDLPNNTFRKSTNITKGGIADGFQSWAQRKKEVDPIEFWQQWHGTNPGYPETSEEFQTALADAIVAAATVQVNTDSDLAAMVTQYLIDLNAGKKVVLVAHSQGNFYANRAQEFITRNYPELAPSMGIVSVATPSVALAPGAKLTQNRKDAVINGVVASEYSVIPGNVTYTGVNDKSHHTFLATFMQPANGETRISNQIKQMIKQLPEPINRECDPEVAEISTRTAADVSALEATLRADLTYGTNVQAWFVYDTNSSNVVCNDQTRNGAGTFTAPFELQETVFQLTQNKSYYFRACAKGAKGGISDGGLRQFVTERNTGKVETPSAASITGESFLLTTKVLEGENIDVWFRLGAAGGSSAPSCFGTAGSYDGFGVHSVGDTVTSKVTGLRPSTTYPARGCAKGSDGRTTSSNTGYITTNSIPVLPCSDQSFRGGASGLAAVYDYGGKKGSSSVTFQTFTIPDGLTIFKRATNQVLLQTNGLISGLNTYSFNVDDSFSEVDIIVTGNSISTTEWELTLRCPPG